MRSYKITNELHCHLDNPPQFVQENGRLVWLAFDYCIQIVDILAEVEL